MLACLSMSPYAFIPHKQNIPTFQAGILETYDLVNAESWWSNRSATTYSQ